MIRAGNVGIEEAEQPMQMGMSMAEVSQALRARTKIGDDLFDAFYSPEMRRLSSRHWTPVEVALRASELLATTPGMKVLDVGSGAGKFCLIGALSTDANYIGVEQRLHLVEEARSLKTSLGAERAQFMTGDAFNLDWRDFDAFYLFNPFHEHVLDETASIDRSISIGLRHHIYSVWLAQAQLSRANLGARVVTYHGFGGLMPRCYRKVTKEACGTDVVELWVKERSSDGILNRTA